LSFSKAERTRERTRKICFAVLFNGAVAVYLFNLFHKCNTTIHLMVKYITYLTHSVKYLGSLLGCFRVSMPPTKGWTAVLSGKKTSKLMNSALVYILTTDFICLALIKSLYWPWTNENSFGFPQQELKLSFVHMLLFKSKVLT